MYAIRSYYVEENDRNIKNVVETFLQLSTDISNPNPTGIEVINLDLNLENEDGSTPEPSEDDYTSLPLLDILNMGAIDYHIARLLGFRITSYNVCYTKLLRRGC